jgi:hypothetical protein
MKSKRKYYFIGTVIFLFVLATILICIFMPEYLDSFLVFTVGCVLCGVAIVLTVDTYSCKEKVSAVFINYGFEQFKAHITSSPVFTYQYQGKTYTSSAAECLSQRYVLKHYKEGEIYTIYVSEKDPSLIKTRRHIRIFDLALFLVGVVIIVLSVVSIFLIQQ